MRAAYGQYTEWLTTRADSLTRWLLSHRTRSARRARGPRRRVLRRADRARRRELSDQRPARARRSRHRHHPRQEGRRRSQRARSAASTPTSRDAIVAAADEILAGQPARSVRRRRLPGRRRHLAQHERERGARQPRRRNPRRAARHLHARAPERSRQHGPVDQRRVPDGDAAGAAARRTRRWSTRRARSPTASRDKADEFADVLKTGRTHLQDAVPMTLGQEFGGYAACVAPRRRRCRARRRSSCCELNIGATAVGTGLNAGDDYRRLVVANLARYTGLPLQAGGESVSRHAEHGRRARVLGRDAAARGRARQGRERSAAAQHGAARRACRDRAAGRAAGIVDHAGQGESVGAGDGQPGLLPGDGLRHDGRAWPARRVSSS